METLKTMTMFGDGGSDSENEGEEQVPTCATKGSTLKKILVWTECRNYFKQMNLKETFEIIVSSDYLANTCLLEEMCKKVFLNNSHSVINEAVSEFENGTLTNLLDDFTRRNEVIVTLHQDKLRYF